MGIPMSGCDSEAETELVRWPSGRLSKLVGSIPIGFEDDAMEARFRDHNHAALHSSLGAAVAASISLITLGVIIMVLTMDMARMSYYKILHLLACSLPIPCAAIILRHFSKITVSEWALAAFLVWVEASLLLSSSARFAFVFAGTDALAVFEDPDNAEVSDAFTVMNLSIMVMLYFVLVPVRAKLSLVMLPIVPSLYLAMSIPVNGLEGPGSSRILKLAFRLLVLTIAGLMARVRFENQERLLFSRLTASEKKCVEERVLRFEVEHREEQAAQRQHADIYADNETSTKYGRSNETGSDTNSLALSSVIFTPHERVDTSLQLRAMKQLAQVEGWLIHPQDLVSEPDQVLGSGGFGVVLRGLFAGGAVAIKTHQRLLSTSRQVTYSVGRELRALRNLRHPCIVSFYGAVIDEAKPEIFMVEELIYGESLLAYIKGKADIRDRRKWTFLCQLISVLEFLHRDDPGIIHGDIKPSNVMITTGRNVKLIDFGLSWKTRSHGLGNGGSLAYLAPELLLGQGVSYGGDVFAFGRLAYFVATEHEPLIGLQKEKLVELAQRQELPELHWGNSTFESCCKDLCNACFSTESGRPSAGSALDLIKSWQLAKATSEKAIVQL